MSVDIHADAVGVGICSPRHTGPFVDWLAMSFPPEVQVELLERKLQELIHPDHLILSPGMNGYHQSYRNEGKTVRLAVAGGHEGMGPHLEITGKACDRYEEDLRELMDWALWHDAKFSRLDLTLDEPVGVLDLNEIVSSLGTGGCVSKFRKAPRVESFYHSQTGELTGQIVRFGSRTSKVSIRFYDKALQQGEDFHWLRVELELKAEVAQQVVKDWLSGVSLGNQFWGILSSYLSFRRPTEDNNRSRWPVEPWWQLFLDQGPKSSFHIRSEPPKDDLDWFLNGYDKVLARAARKFGPHVFQEMVESGERKLQEQSLH